MKLYGKAWRRARYRHWETWAALGVLAACVWLGGFLGSRYLGHPLPLVVAGAVIGGLVTYHTNQFVKRRYNR